MSFVQIPTSSTVMMTAIQGYNGVSLTNWATSAASVIAAGSAVEVAGAFFSIASDDTNDATSFSAITTGATAYLQLVPSGTVGSQILTSSWTSTAPTWRTDKFGWYASAGSATRIVAGCVKTGPTAYEYKFIMQPIGSISGSQSFGGAVTFTGTESHSGAVTFTSAGSALFNGGINNPRRAITKLTSGSGTYTVPVGVYQLSVICVGGGGNGGNGASGNSGCGGGGGGTIISQAIAQIISVTPGQTISYAVGAAATQSTFGAIVGSPGSNGANGSGGSGGAGGAGSTDGAGDDGSVGGPSLQGGKGGGAGGAGGTTAGSAGSSGKYGGGGGGGSGQNGGTGGAGGAGGGGIIIVECL